MAAPIGVTPVLLGKDAQDWWSTVECTVSDSSREKGCWFCF